MCDDNYTVTLCFTEFSESRVIESFESLHEAIELTKLLGFPTVYGKIKQANGIGFKTYESKILGLAYVVITDIY